MTEPEVPTKADNPSSSRLPCIHCRYDIRGLAGDAKCPECGQAVSDTREGTFFYRLPASRLNSITIGTGLFALGLASSTFYSAAQAVERLGLGPGAGSAFFSSAVYQATAHIAGVWVPVFLLAAPLHAQRDWRSPLRLAWMGLLGVEIAGQLIGQLTRFSSAQPSRLLSTAEIVSWYSGSVLILLTLIRLSRHAARLPGSPGASLAAGAICCWVTTLLVSIVLHTQVLERYPATFSISAALYPLLMAPAVAFAFLQFRELRAIARDVDADHPYTRI